MNNENAMERLRQRIEELQVEAIALEEQIRSDAKQILRLEAANKSNRKKLTSVKGLLAAHKRVLRDLSPPEEAE